MQLLGQGRAQVEEKEKANETSSINTSEESTTLSNSAAISDHVLKGTLKSKPGLPNVVQPPRIQTQRKGATNNDDDDTDDVDTDDDYKFGYNNGKYSSSSIVSVPSSGTSTSMTASGADNAFETMTASQRAFAMEEVRGLLSEDTIRKWTLLSEQQQKQQIKPQVQTKLSLRTDSSSSSASPLSSSQLTSNLMTTSTSIINGNINNSSGTSPCKVYCGCVSIY
jgi:hypothetical protein